MGWERKEVLEVLITVMVGLGVFKEYSQDRVTWVCYGGRRNWALFRPNRDQWLDKFSWDGEIS